MSSSVFEPLEKFGDGKRDAVVRFFWVECWRFSCIWRDGIGLIQQWKTVYIIPLAAHA